MPESSSPRKHGTRRMFARGRIRGPSLAQQAVAELAWDVIDDFARQGDARILAFRIEERYGPHTWQWAPQNRLVHEALLKALADHIGHRDDTYPDRLAFTQKVEVERVRLEEEKRRAKAEGSGAA